MSLSLKCPECGQAETFRAYRSYMHKLYVDADLNVLDDDYGMQEGPGEIDEFGCPPCGHDWKPGTDQVPIGDETKPVTLGGRGSLGQRYEKVQRLAAAADAIEIRALPLSPGDPSRDLFYAFKAAAEANLEEIRQEHFESEGWAYGEEPPGAGLHPDDVDPTLARRVMVIVIDAEDGDLEIHTVGSFPMLVGEHEDPDGNHVEVVVESEADLEEWVSTRGLPFSYIDPAPTAEQRTGQRSNWRDVLGV